MRPSPAWIVAGALASAALAPGPAHGQTWDELIDGGGDAASHPGRPAQLVTRPLRAIRGATSALSDDFVDAYIIRVADPAAFYATTDPLVDPLAQAGFNTRLFLFRPGGGPVMANDDSPLPLAALGESTIAHPAFFAGLGAGGTVSPGIPALESGIYILAVAGASQSPVDAMGRDVFGPLASGLRALAGPNPVAETYERWDLGAYGSTGAYTVALRGVAPIPAPPAAGLLALAGLVRGRRRRCRAAPRRAAGCS